MTSADFFTDNDPLGEYRWREVGAETGHAMDAVWAYGGRTAQLSRHVLVPHWKVCLAVRRQWDARRDELADCRLMLLGPVASARVNAEPAGSEIIAVRLQPEYTARLLRIAAADIAGLDIDLPANPSFDALRRLGESGASQAAIGGALLKWACQAPSDHCPSVTHRAGRLIRASGGKMTMNILARHVEVSERSLRRHFRDDVGISPKSYARMVRLKHVLLDADRQRTPDWASVALDHGYSDQSHLCNEIRSLTDLTVAQIHAMRRAHP